jgi:hypothetical protein
LYIKLILKECRLRVLENRILGRIFEFKWDEKRKWRVLHNEELHSFYHSSNIVNVIKPRRLRWAGLVARMEEYLNAFNILTGKKRP